VPARLDIDGTPEQPPRKRGRSPKISPDIDEKELDELGLSSPEERVAAQLRSMVSSIEELRISMTSFENDVFQRLDDNSKAAALMREGGAQDTAKNLVKLEATMAELHETVTVMITLDSDVGCLRPDNPCAVREDDPRGEQGYRAAPQGGTEGNPIAPHASLATLRPLAARSIGPLPSVIWALAVARLGSAPCSNACYRDS